MALKIFNIKKKTLTIFFMMDVLTGLRFFLFSLARTFRKICFCLFLASLTKKNYSHKVVTQYHKLQFLEINKKTSEYEEVFGRFVNFMDLVFVWLKDYQSVCRQKPIGNVSSTWKICVIVINEWELKWELLFTKGSKLSIVGKVS